MSPRFVSGVAFETKSGALVVSQLIRSDGYFKTTKAAFGDFKLQSRLCPRTVHPLKGLRARAFGYRGPSGDGSHERLVRIYAAVDAKHLVCITVKAKRGKPLPTIARKLLPIALKRARQ